MLTPHWLKLAVAGLLVALGMSATQAQNRDVVRVAVHQPVPLMAIISNPSPETLLVTNIVYDSLVYFDAAKREYVPLLAKSFERIAPTTYEFKLREGVTFHDGSAFDADDVVTSIQAFVDPK